MNINCSCNIYINVLIKTSYGLNSTLKIFCLVPILKILNHYRCICVLWWNGWPFYLLFQWKIKLLINLFLSLFFLTLFKMFILYVWSKYILLLYFKVSIQGSHKIQGVCSLKICSDKCDQIQYIPYSENRVWDCAR